MNYKSFLKLSEKLIKKIYAVNLGTPKKLECMTFKNIRQYDFLD